MSSYYIRHNRTRRGVAVTQWCVVGVLILVAIVTLVASLGTNTRNHLNTSATNAGNPSSLPARFGSGS